MTNNINLLPGCAATAGLLAAWQENHLGNSDDFYEWLTQPSAERDAWLASQKCEIVNEGIYSQKTIAV